MDNFSKVKLLCLVVCSVFMTSCTTIPVSYVSADEKTFDCIATEYLDYVDKDESLDKEDKMLRHDLVKEWERRILAGRR